MPSSEEPEPRITLTDLPSEILSAVARSLDVPSALSFARVAPGLADHADARVWRKLDLVFRDESNYDYSRADDRGPPSFAVNMAEQAHKIGIRKKVKAVLRSGSARRWRMVEEVTLVPRSGATVGMIEILGHVAPNLQSLTIRGPRSVFDFPVKRHQALDLQLQDGNFALQFPKLRHIQLDWASMFYISFVAYLCAAAPNLDALEIYYNTAYHEELRPDSLIRYPHSFKQDTLLRRMHIHHRVDVGPNEEYDSWAHLISLLAKSPILEQLVIVSSFDDFPEEKILPVIGKLSCLRDLYWSSPSMRYENLQQRNGQFPNLRRLVTLQMNWELPRDLGPFPSLELLCCDRGDWSWEFRDSVMIFPNSPAVQPLPSTFAAWLRSCPRLRHIHTFRNNETPHEPHIFSTLDGLRSSDFTSTIQSTRYGEGELLQVRLLVQEVETDAMVEGRYVERKEWRRVIYAAGQDADFDDIGVRYRDPVVQVLTDFDGLVVPLDIIDQMRVVEGVEADEEWDLRGVEVGDAAWDVLLKWRDGQVSVTE